MQSLNPVELPFHKLTRWLCTHVDSISGHIFCHLAEPSISVKYERLEEHISGWDKAGRLEMKAVQPTIGELVLAKYSVDNRWYRSQITEIYSDTKEVEVLFLDYGNTETVAFSDLRELSGTFTNLPAHAVECVLAEIEPFTPSGRWSDKAIVLLKELVLDQELPGMAVGLKRKNLLLKLYADEKAQVTVAAQLIAAGFGQSKSSKPSSSCSSSIVRSNSVSSVSSSGSSKNSKQLSAVAKSMKSFRNIPLVKEQYMNVCVVYSEGIARFFCQSDSFKNDIDNLQEKVQNICNDSKTKCITNAQVNQICCAKFNEDNQFYRAIIKALQDDSCYVFFVDYGNSAMVPLQDIREVEQELLQLPALAIECSLSGIQPLNASDYSKEANEKFDELTADKLDLLGLINNIEKGKVELILYDEDEVPIAEKLAKSNLVTLIKPNSNVSANVSSVKSDSTSKSQANVKIKYMSLDFKKGQQYSIFVSYIINPHHFYINPGNSTEHIDKIMEELQLVYNSGEHQPLKTLEVGQPCVCKFIEDDRFYRCQVQSFDKSTANVLYVDYGNTEKVELNEVFPLRKEFIKLSKQAACCKLSNVQPANGEFSIEAKESFENMVLDKSLIMIVDDIKDNVFQVSLKEISGNKEIPHVDVAKVMLLSGHAQKTSLQVPSPDKYGKQITSPDVTYKEQLIEVDSLLDAVPIVIVDPGNFCCHLVKNTQPFKEMTSHLNEYYSKTNPDMNLSWQKMMPCVALYEDDNCWYRATILSVSKDKAEVVFVDFGNSANVSFANLRRINEYFMKLPSQIFVCSLANIQPINGGSSWTDAAAENFDKLVFEKQLACHVKEQSASSNIYSVELYDTKTTPEVNIEQWLIERKFAVSVVKQTEKLCQAYPTVRNSEKVYVSSVTGFNEFYIQCLHLSSDLDTMMNKIHEYYSCLNPSDLIITRPIIGQYCCAKFSQDDGFYRAKIEEVEGNNISVFYIDYGNSECLNLNVIKSLTTEFESFNSFAIPCKLSGVNHVGNTNQHEIINEKEFEAVFLNTEAPYEVDLRVDGKSILGDVLALFGDKKQEVVKIPPGVIEGKSANVFCLEAQSLEHFYCQLSSEEAKLNQLMENIATYMETSNTGQVRNGFCLAKYIVDDGWYRAQIKEQNGTKLRVFYCDYGNEDVIDENMVAEIPKHLAVLPQQAIPCTLSLFSSVTNQNGLLGHFNCQCTSSNVTLNICTKNANDVYVVEVLLNGTNIVTSFLPNTTTPAPTSEKSITVSQETFSIKPAEVEANTKLNGVCYVIESTDTIKCQLTKYEESLNALMNDIDSQANDLPTLSPKIDDVCIAKYAEDGGWYRGRVKSIEGDDINIHFIDYGNSDKVPKSEIKQMTSEFAQLPQCCVTVNLYDVHVDDLQQEKGKMFLESLLEKSVTIEVIDVSSANKVSAYVYEEGSDVHVNDKLYEVAPLDDTPDVIVEDESPTTTNILTYAKPTIDNKETGTCTYVPQSTDSFSLMIQLKKYEEQLNTLMEKLSGVAMSSSPLQNISAGITCLAQYSVDNEWYRAIVLNMEEGAASVLFVDYGNYEKISLNQLKPLTEDLVELPATCVRCNLHDVHMEDLEKVKVQCWLEEQMQDQIVSLDIQSKDDSENVVTLSAYIYNQSNEETHVNDILYEMFPLEQPTVEPNKPKEIVADVVTATSENLQETVNDAAVPDIEPTPSKSTPQTSQSQDTVIEKPTLAIGTTENCMCFVVESATEMSCQLSKFQAELDSLMIELANDAPSLPVLESPEKDKFCIAKYSIDEGWYRGRIVETGSDISVEFIDFGNTDKVPQNDIKQIPAKYTQLCQTCISVKLHDVHLEDIDVNATKTFLEGKLEHTLRVEIVELISDVAVSAYVYDEGREDHINDQIYENFAIAEETESSSTTDVVKMSTEANADSVKISTEANADSVKISTDSNADSVEMSTEATAETINETAIETTTESTSETTNEVNTETVKVEKPSLTIGTTENCMCFVVESATEMSCQLSKFQAELDSLMIELANDAPSLPVLESPEKDKFCIAKYSVDEGWYRGRIVETGNDISVEFIDFGNTDKVPQNDIKQIPAKYTQLCQTCISVKLHDVHLEDIDVNATKTFLEGKLEHTLRVEIVELISDVAVSAYVYDEGREDHINDQIYENFAIAENTTSLPTADDPNVSEEKPASSKFTISNPELASGATENAYCTFVESAVVLKCQLSKFEQQIETLPILLTSVASNNTLPENVAVGDFCIAKYSSDGCWYRAQVTKENNEDISVKFIDYGNNDIVKRSEVREINEQIAVLPRTCIDVQLHDVHVTDIDISKAKEWLESNLGDHLVTLDVVSVHDNIVEAYVMLDNVNINDKLYELFEKSDPTVTANENVEAQTPLSSSKDNASVAAPEKTDVDVVVDNAIKTQDIDQPPVNSAIEKTDEPQNIDEPPSVNNEENLTTEVNSATLMTASEVDLETVKTTSDSSENPAVTPSELEIESSDSSKEDHSEARSATIPSLDEQPAIVGNHEVANEEAEATDDIPKLPSTSIESYDGVVTCTFVDPSDFILWCRPNKYDSYIEQISVLLSREPDCASENFNISRLNNGDAVITKSEDDGMWYRSVVLSLINSDEIKIRHADFGSTENVKRQNISKITNEIFLSEPATCFSCRLQDVYQSDVDVKKAIDWLQEKLEEASISLTCSTNDNNEREAYVYLAGNNVVSINDQIYEHFAIEAENVNEIPSQNEVVTQIAEKNKEVGTNFIPRELKVGASEKAFCTVVDSSTVIRCQLTKFSNELDNLMEYIASVGEDLECLTTPKEGQACIAPYHQDLALYRARILSVSDATSKVEFVDYGNVDDVINEDFKLIEEQMLSKPLFCVTCQLSDVCVLPEHEKEAVDYLTRTLVDSGDEITLQVNDYKDGKYYVSVFNDNNDINKHMKEEFGDWECVYRPANVNLGDKINVEIPSTDSLEKFWCRITDHSEKLGNLMMNISTLYDTKREPLQTYTPGQPCCALNENTNTYYRAVIEKDDGEDLRLLYVDYGVTENVPKSNVFVLLSRFFKLPRQAFQACLFDLQPFKDSSIFSQDAVNLFNEKSNGTTLSATVVSRSEEKYALALVLPNGDTFYELLIEQQLAKPGNRLSSPVNTPVVTNGH